MAFELPELPYAYDALAPYMSAETLEFHHDKHHNAYVTAGNDLIKGTEYADMSLEDVVKKSHADKPGLFNQAINAGKTQFGSGWCWLALKGGKLEVMKTPNGENPLIHDATPLLGCDVWEHSYYIDYRNLRPKYLEAFFDNLVNWDHVAELYEGAS